MKKLVRIVAALAVLLIVAVGVLVMSIDALAKRAVEAAGTHALGTPTSVGGMRIGLLNPSASMSSFAVANPAAYAKDGPESFLSLREGTLAVDAPSLMGDVVRIPSVRLTDLSLNLVQIGGESNASTILANIRRSVGGGSGGTAPSSSSGRRFVIDELVIENITISARASGLPIAAPAANLTVAKVRLESLGSAGKDPVGMEQLVAIVVNAVMQAALEAGASQLPSQLVQGMLGGMAGLGGDLSNFGLSIDTGDGLKPVGDLAGMAQRLGVDLSALSKQGTEQVQKGLDDLGKKIEDAGGEAGEKVKQGLDDLFKKK